MFDKICAGFSGAFNSDTYCSQNNQTDLKSFTLNPARI